MNHKKYFSKKAQMSYTQILILIISSFAFCYLIYSVENVSAQGIEDYACCEETLDGNSCQFVDFSQCSSNYRSAPTQCKDTSYCKSGCCYSLNTGLCSENSPKRNCQGGWTDDTSCNIARCQKGCCVLGNNALWTTQENCEIETGFLGLETDFRPEINSEVECIFLAERDDEGACVLGNDCKFTTRGECSSRNGDFYKNNFCSNPSFENNCIAKEHKECVEGKDSVYWFDSCGNRESVAKECSLFTGTYCGLVAGNYDCKSVDCMVDGKKRKNGESWCEYEGTIGNGKDVVGSRHIKHICYMGEERIEPCQDYRNQICVESEINLEESETFSEAACRINNWRSCLDYNTIENQEEAAKKCEENPDCTTKGVHIDKFNFDLCTPKYPPGFDLINEAGGRNAEMVCSMGSQKCTVIYVKKISGWKCKVNCACKDAGFTQQMNNFCTSLGDCGGYVNIAGQTTDDGYKSGAGKIDLNQYKKYARNNPNQKPAEPSNLSFLFGEPSGAGFNEDYGLKNAMGVGGIGFAAGVISNYLVFPHLGVPGAISTTINTGGAGAASSFPSSVIGPFADALAAAGAVMVGASILSMAFDIDYTTALVISTVAGAGYVIYVEGATTISEGLMALSKLAIPLLIIYIIFKLIGIGKTKKKVVDFQCLPWQPPTGGSDCSKCNTYDAFGVPCTDYRCKSLGQTCELINKGTGQEKCIDNSPTDVSSPRISPLFGTISEGYEYYNIQNTGFRLVDSSDKACIPEFTPIEFGIKTNKPAQCKIGEDPLQTYDQMSEYFGGSNLFLTNHTNIMFMPSPEAFKNQYNLTDEQIKALGEINFYIKCKSVNGVVNSASYTIKSCVKPGKDLTAPRIARTSPANGAYVGYNQTKQDVNLWINEPANCKYSTEDKDYSLMENSFNCQQDLEDYGLYGWPCDEVLDLGGNNEFYIRCQDISDNQNAMSQSYIYSLEKSASNLKIDEVRPVDGKEIFSGVEPMTVELQVETSGGAEQGKVICYYDFGNSEVSFYETDSNYHNQEFNQITRGAYNIDIRCEDVAGNSAEASTSFRIRIDSSGPKIIRMYYDGGMKVITNEQAECRYDFEKNFKWDDAEIMSGDGIEHIGDWQLRTYYIQCSDEYKNKGGKVRIRAYSLI